MKTYELVIEQRQPTCGNQAPTRCEILTVTTDDPLAYVRSREPGSALEVVSDADGVLVIRSQRNGLWANYEFTED